MILDIFKQAFSFKLRYRLNKRSSEACNLPFGQNLEAEPFDNFVLESYCCFFFFFISGVDLGNVGITSLLKSEFP